MFSKLERAPDGEMVTRILALREPPKPDDTADALALAICHAHSGASRIASYYNKNTI